MIKRISALLGLFFLLSAAFAQETRVVTLVVPYSAGSAQDIFARLISEPLSKELKTRVMVVNKPGAGGTLGAAYVAQAKPDGLTYLVAASGHHLAGALHAPLSYHPLRSFQGAAFFGYSDFVLIATSELKTPDLAAFVTLVKKHPNAYNFASAGSGSTTHVGMTSFLQRAGLSMLHLPMKGTNEVINEVLSGRVQAAIVSSLSIQSYKADPRIQLLGIASAHRSAQFAHLPTLAESGLTQFQWTAWAGLLAPAGTPASMIGQMNRAFNKLSNETPMRTRLEQLGTTHNPMTALQFDTFLRDNWLQSSALISKLNITQD
jgi:tripartite-type tricarboxylate transporter receptor subunit TctC